MPERNDKLAFAALMAALGTAFGDNGMPKARAAIYYEHLRDIPIDSLERAVEFIIRSRKYSSIPTIAEIREAALGRDEDIETAALEGWALAKREVAFGYRYEDGKMVYGGRDAILDEAVRVAFGGWYNFGQTNPENEIADRAHFLRVFKGLARRRRELGELALPAGPGTRRLRGRE